MFVTAKGKTIEVEKGIRFQDIVPYFQSEEEYPLLLAKVGSRIYELHKKLPEEDITIEWITIRDSIGMQSYQRSAIFMLLKAFYHHCKGIKDFNVSIDYTLGGGFYGHLSGDVRLTADLLSKVKATMEGYADYEAKCLDRRSTGVIPASRHAIEGRTVPLSYDESGQYLLFRELSRLFLRGNAFKYFLCNPV